MGPTSTPDGPYVGPMNFAKWDGLDGLEGAFLKPYHFTDMGDFSIQKHINVCTQINTWLHERNSAGYPRITQTR